MCLMFCIDHQLAYFMTGIIVNRRLGTGGWSVVTTHHGWWGYHHISNMQLLEPIIQTAWFTDSISWSWWKCLCLLWPGWGEETHTVLAEDNGGDQESHNISLLICNHIPVNTNLRPVPADHTNDIRHSSTFPQGPGSDYFLILDVTPPMSNWPSILRAV